MAGRGRGPGARTLSALGAGLLVLALCATAALAAFPQDPPNDPSYAPAEGGFDKCLTESINSEQHHLYSFMPRCGLLDHDPEGAAGMSVDRAWREFTTGDPGTVIAYIEGGINWHSNPRELVNKVFLNAGELPAPTTPIGDGWLNAQDYADTADANGNGLVDPEDIIVRFSDGADDDGNGYVDDISGWDFYDDQNDPATVDTAYSHANGQMEQAAAETDNGIGGAGVCPDCMLLPIKAGAEALDRTDDLAQAWLYAADAGADVIVSTTADLGFSSFMRQAVEYVWDQGVVMVESSNDFNSTDHQGGMFWPHVLPGNGLVTNSQLAALGDVLPAPLSNILTLTYRARSAYTSFGAHNMFSVATQGGTTSESTPTVGGVMALVLSYSKQAAAEAKIAAPLTNAEAIQVVRATASDIAVNPNPPLGWRGKPGFDLQYGYGRPNVYKAMQAISEGRIPPVAWIDSPDWFSLHDPTQTPSVPVSGHVEAPRSSSYSWKLEFAPGAEPTDSQFITAATGSGTSPTDGALGSLDLTRIPPTFWQKRFALSRTKYLETNEHYTVTIRLRVTDAEGGVGEERRAIAVHHDPTLRDGFPKRIGPGGEAQPVLADLQGTGELAAIFGDSDGVVHAIDPNGNELPGWPVTTEPTEVTKSHPGIDPGHEPVLVPAAVGDLDHDGELWVVVSTTTGRSYVWDSHGNPRPGWPKLLDAGVSPPSIPRPQLPFTRLPHVGATASPVLADLDGDSDLEIVQAGWNGRIHVWRADGSDLSGWPLEVTLGSHPVGSGKTRVQDHKIDIPPALAQLDGDPEPELVVRPQYNDVAGSGLQFGGTAHLIAYNADGSVVPGYPNDFESIVTYYGSAQEFITEGANAPTIADVDGDGRDEIAASPGIFSPTTLFGPDGSSKGLYGPLPDVTLGLLNGNLSLQTVLGLLAGDLPTDAPVTFTTSGAFGRFAGGLSFAEPGTGAVSAVASLLTPGVGAPINNFMRVFDAKGGLLPKLGFPSEAQGLDFLGVPTIADVTGDGRAEVLQGGDSSALHAYNVIGRQAAGFPKFHTGWVVWAPVPGDLDGDGKLELVAATREGYLMAWDTPGRADANVEWWNWRHDEWNTSRYGVDSRPPGILRNAALNGAGTALSLRAPGDDWYAGRAQSYELVTSASPITAANFDAATALGGEPAPAVAGATQTVAIPPSADRYVAIRAVDEAGNVGRIAAFDTGP